MSDSIILGDNPLLIWDLDNTLIRCGEYYKQAEEEFVRHFASSYNLPEAMVRLVLQTIDHQSCYLSNGFDASRFPRSFAAAAAALATVVDHPVTQADTYLARYIASKVFTAPYDMFDGAEEVLNHFKALEVPMIMVTKGDPKVQWSKYEKRELSRWIIPDNFHVVGVKNPAVYEAIVSQYRPSTDFSQCVMIGDSLKDDIAPAKEVNLRTVHVAGNHFKWAWESGEAVPDLQVHTLSELPEKLIHG